MRCPGFIQSLGDCCCGLNCTVYCLLLSVFSFLVLGTVGNVLQNGGYLLGELPEGASAGPVWIALAFYVGYFVLCGINLIRIVIHERRNRPQTKVVELEI